MSSGSNLRKAAIVATVAAIVGTLFLLSRERLPVLREAFPPSGYFKPLASDTLHHFRGGRVTLEFRPKFRGRHGCFVRFSKASHLSPGDSSLQVKVEATLRRERDGDALLRFERPTYFRDRRGGGILVGRFDVPSQAPLDEPSYLILEMLGAGNTNLADPCPCSVEVMKLSDL